MAPRTHATRFATRCCCHCRCCHCCCCCCCCLGPKPCHARQQSCTGNGRKRKLVPPMQTSQGDWHAAWRKRSAQAAKPYGLVSAASLADREERARGLGARTSLFLRRLLALAAEVGGRKRKHCKPQVNVILCVCVMCMMCMSAYASRCARICACVFV